MRSSGAARRHLDDRTCCLTNTKLWDDKGRASWMVETNGPGSMLHTGNGERQAGRILFKPQLAPDARRLTLQLDGGAHSLRDCDAGGSVCGLDIDLGPIPAAALPALAMPNDARRLDSMALRETPPTYPLESSQLDRVAQLKQELKAVDDHAGTRVELPGDVLFDFDQPSLRADAGPTLDKLAELISRMNRPAHITGYTDSKGDDAYNLKLSYARARAVRDALLARKVDAGRLTDTQGRGEANPKAPNTRADGSDDPRGRQLNRRVEVLIEAAAARTK